MSNLECAQEYLDRGWSIIPINPQNKVPLIEWREYQGRLPTPEEVEAWWTEYPYAMPGIITGERSGLYIVDVDDDSVFAAAKAAGVSFNTPIKVKTRRGYHFYFAHPFDGHRRGPRVGATGSADPAFPWPQIKGLDWKGDGGYAVLPHPGGPYQWLITPGHDFDDMPEWRDLSPMPGAGTPDDPAQISLAGVRVPSPDAHLSEWEKAEKLASTFNGGLIPTGHGNGRNTRVMRHISECIRAGHWDDLEQCANDFMDRFFVDRLPPRSVQATIRSMQLSERRNHPENFDSQGKWIGGNRASHLPQLGAATQNQPQPASTPINTQSNVQPSPPPPPPPPPFIFMRDADALARQAKARGMILDPFIPSGGTIIQVYGYTGSGKSTFVQHMCAALAAASPAQGNGDWGPFEIVRRSRVLYLNFEEGRRTIADRMLELRKLYGDTGDNWAMWAPFMDMDLVPSLNSEAFLTALTGWLRSYRPDVVVIDTVRTAWPGLEENKAEAWNPVNQLALKLRNVGLAVVMLHHGNKPSGDSAVGSEAGNTNQLTNIETQLRIARVYERDDEARLNAAVAASKLVGPDFCLTPDMSPWDWLKQNTLRQNERLSWVFEVRRRKVRELTYEFAPAYLIGFAVDLQTGARRLVSTLGPKQAARFVTTKYGTPPIQIAETLGVPLPVVMEWIS